MRLRFVGCLLLVGTTLMASAEIRLPHVLSDHAVLQRDRPIHLWGWAGSGEHIQVRFHDQKAEVQADDTGTWDVWLKPEAAGGPFELRVEGDQTAKPLVRTDILMGDVWLASGQSNMELPLKGFDGAPVKNGAAEIAAANHPQLRLLLGSKRVAVTMWEDGDTEWAQCTPDTAKDFSAAAYFFAREISEKEHVPVGVIDVTWGGTPIQSWISGEGIGEANLPLVQEDGGRVAREQGHIDTLRSWQKAQDAALKAAGKPVPPRGRIPGDHQSSWVPSVLFNGMIAPYTPYTIKGVIWYQGETDTTSERAPNYGRAMDALITDWRRQWAEGPFPFLFVQLSSFERNLNWAVVREGQRQALGMANTGMVVSLDIGETNNIHPANKQAVGHRLAQLAGGMAYGEPGTSSSPLFLQATPEGNSIRVWFTHAAGLHSSDKRVGNFEVAGENLKWFPAEGRIDGETIVVSSSSVASPRYVRYGWAGTVTSYFYNDGDLPVGTFTSQVR